MAAMPADEPHAIFEENEPASVMRRHNARYIIAAQALTPDGRRSTAGIVAPEAACYASGRPPRHYAQMPRQRPPSAYVIACSRGHAAPASLPDTFSSLTRGSKQRRRKDAPAHAPRDVDGPRCIFQLAFWLHEGLSCQVTQLSWGQLR